jgi:tetrapyrrole methylase family protein/MazG family protein
MATSRDISETGGFEKLIEVIRELRRRCPWDREQTLGGMGKYLIEEAYEATDAIERNVPRAIAEELGDLLVQVLFAAVMAEEVTGFKVAELLQWAAEKLVRRHPHVYASAKADTADEVVANWNQLKAEERKAAGFRSALAGIAQSLPALSRAQKLGSRAREAGLDWADIHDVLAKVREEMDEVEGALARNDRDEAAVELGDMLLALANAPRFIGHDAEQTLRRSCDKFIRRFATLEEIAAERGLEIARMTAVDLESLWQETKQREKTAREEN